MDESAHGVDVLMLGLRFEIRFVLRAVTDNILCSFISTEIYAVDL